MRKNIYNSDSLCYIAGINIVNQLYFNKILKNIFFFLKKRSSHCGVAETNATRNNEVMSSIPGLAPWVKDPTSQ